MNDLDEYLRQVEQRQNEATAAKETYQRDDDAVYVSQADVPVLLDMLRYFLYCSDDHLRSPRENDRVKCFCRQCTTGRRVNERARQAMACCTGEDSG